MPNRDVHGPVGTASGGLYAVYMSYGQPLSHVMAEAAGALSADTPAVFFRTGSM